MDPQQPFITKKKIIIFSLILCIVLLSLLIFSLVISQQKKGSLEQKKMGADSTTSQTSSQGQLGTRKVALKPIINQPQHTEVILPSPDKKILENIYIQVLNWLDGMRNPDGVYKSDYVCDENKTCKSNFVENRVGVVTSWARLEPYRKTRQQPDLEAVIRDLQTYADATKVSSIQNSYWNCRLQYEIDQSKFLFEPYTTLPKSICDRGVYDPAVMEAVEKEVSSGSYTLVDIPAFIQGKAVVPDTSLDSNLLGLYGMYASDFAVRYRWTQSTNDLKIATLLFSKGVQMYSRGVDPADVSDGEYALGVAGVDLYLATRNIQYKDVAVLMMNRRKAQSCERLSACVMKAYLYHMLASVKVTGMLEKRNTAVSLLVKSFFDDTKTGTYLKKGAFYEPAKSTNLTIYPVFQNAVMLYILASMK